jgi:hypothetical protein
LTPLRGKMYFNDFAKAAELLGRQSPTGKQLMEDPVVKSAPEAAWAASNVDAKDPNDWRENGLHIHERDLRSDLYHHGPAEELGQDESSGPRLEDHSREHNRSCHLPHAS